MKRSFLVGSVLASSLLLASCSSNGQETLKGLSEHLQARDCQTQGTVILGGLGTSTAQMSWVCPKPRND